MNIKQKKAIIKKIFGPIEKAFPYFVAGLILKLSNYQLSLAKIYKNSDSELGNLVKFVTPNGNYIIFIASDSSEDPEYGDIFAIHETNIDRYNEEMAYEGTFMKNGTNYSYNNTQDRNKLSAILKKYINLKREL